MANADAGTQPTRAWTLTGVYGTGKSAFAHYLASLFAPETNTMRHYALAIAKNALNPSSYEYRVLEENIPRQGLFRAVATAQREPLSHTIIRALERGAGIFWKQGGRTQPAIARKLVDLEAEITFGNTTVDSRMIIGLIQEVAVAAQTDILVMFSVALHLRDSAGFSRLLLRDFLLHRSLLDTQVYTLLSPETIPPQAV